MNDFQYTDESFADIQLLRYKVEDFDSLTIRQKTLIYHLTEAALSGRDILYDQNGQFNLRLRRMLEAVYESLPEEPERPERPESPDYPESPDNQEPPASLADAAAFRIYMKRFWFSHGLHHHYGCEKFVPGFSEAWLRQQLETIHYPIDDTLLRVIFDPKVAATRCNQRDGDDLLLTSASNYYQDGITQAEAEAFYASQRLADEARQLNEDSISEEEASDSATCAAGPVQYGLNSRLCRAADGSLYEDVAKIDGHYGPAIRAIVGHLQDARPFAETLEQLKVIDLLIDFYTTGDLRTFDEYSIAWLRDTESRVDFVNGFTETYGDPLGLKASWESIVNFKDIVATRRTETLAQNAQWFEDNSPVDDRFKKPVVRGVSAKVITAAIIAGDLYPATAIGINLPNSDWVRRDHGSKSVTIGNFTDAYNRASRGSGMLEEFCIDEPTRALIRQYGDVCDDLHTDLHECLGHGSGQLLPGVASDALGVYASTIEEARADLFGLYYIADPKLTELGLLPAPLQLPPLGGEPEATACDPTAQHVYGYCAAAEPTAQDGCGCCAAAEPTAQHVCGCCAAAEPYMAAYYTYLQNGLLTQLIRIEPGHVIEEAHMRNRALISRWVLAQAAAVPSAEACLREKAPTVPSAAPTVPPAAPAVPSAEACLREKAPAELISRDGKTYLRINDYAALRSLFGRLLAEVQRIKSEGDFEAARRLVEDYGVQIDAELHAEVRERYARLGLKPYKGFINPVFIPLRNADDEIIDVIINYREAFDKQALRYSREYATL